MARAMACAGIRVLELSDGFGVPALCGQLFAGLGASVRAVGLAGERTRTPAEAYLAALLGAGKQPGAGAGALPSDVEWADVVLVERGAGVPLAELADAAAFEARWPGKILCMSSLFGARSSRPGWTGNELIAEAAGALMACNGYPERPPVTSGLPYALHTSALFAFGAILTALWERDRSGRGQSIDLAIVDCIAAVLGNFLPSYFLSGKPPKRIGNRHTIAAPWNIYPASDGTVVICTGTGGTGWWAKVTDVIGRPELTDDPRYATEADRVRNVDEVDAILSEWTRRLTMREIVDRMSARAIPVGEIGTIEAVLADPHFRGLRAMILPGSEEGLPLAGIPLKVGAWHEGAARSGAAPARAAPALRGMGDRDAPGPLAGIRVIEFASRTSVPLAGRLMADFGAEVVKVEPPKGDALRGAGQQVGGSSYLFQINNAGKRSVMIDPADPKGRDLILELARHADVFVENLAPGSVEKMGLGAAAMAKVNPGLVYCSVSGFGARSGYGSKRALDTVVQAACGMMYMTGYPDHHPVKLGISAVDLATATATMAAVLAGLRERLATGRGLAVDLAMADVGVWMTQKAWPQLLCESRHPVRLGNRSAEACPHDIYAAKDDAFVAVAVETDAQWAALVALIGSAALRDPALADAASRFAARERIDAALAAWASARTAEQAAAACQAAGVPAAPVRDLTALVADPDVTGRGMVVEVDHPVAGALRLLGNPAALSRTPPAVGNGAPALGAHTRAILSGWLGLGEDALAALAAEGVIAGAGLAARGEDAVPAAASMGG